MIVCVCVFVIALYLRNCYSLAIVLMDSLFFVFLSGTARLYNSTTHNCIAKLVGHKGEISKVTFNPQGSRLLTASSDKTARLWDTVSGECVQVSQYWYDCVIM